jgi:hypothetical protein
VHQRLMPGHEKPTAGASEVARRKIVAHPLAPPASPSLDRIKICCEDKNGPPPGGCVAENACSMRTDFLRNNHFTYGFFAVLFSEAFAVQRRHYLRKSRSKTGNGQTPESGLTSESQSIATLALSVVVSRCDKRSEI